jgi:hypothetical protein
LRSIGLVSVLRGFMRFFNMRFFNMRMLVRLCESRLLGSLASQALPA